MGLSMGSRGSYSPIAIANPPLQPCCSSFPDRFRSTSCPFAFGVIVRENHVETALDMQEL